MTAMIDGPEAHRVWMVAAFLLGAIARDTHGAPDAAGVNWPTLTSLPAGPLEVLTHGETRVLRYLPTNLSAREIADVLYVSVNTVKTHQRHLYQKLGARSRSEAVDQARALGLLTPSLRGALAGQRTAQRNPPRVGVVRDPNRRPRQRSSPGRPAYQTLAS